MPDSRYAVDIQYEFGIVSLYDATLTLLMHSYPLWSDIPDWRTHDAHIRYWHIFSYCNRGHLTSSTFQLY